MISQDPLLATYSYISPNLNGLLRGPFCVECMNNSYSSDSFHFHSDVSEECGLPIFLHTKVGGIQYKINELVYLNGSRFPFRFRQLPNDLGLLLWDCRSEECKKQVCQKNSRTEESPVFITPFSSTTFCSTLAGKSPMDCVKNDSTTDGTTNPAAPTAKVAVSDSEKENVPTALKDVNEVLNKMREVSKTRLPLKSVSPQLEPVEVPPKIDAIRLFSVHPLPGGIKAAPVDNPGSKPIESKPVQKVSPDVNVPFQSRLKHSYLLSMRVSKIPLLSSSYERDDEKDLAAVLTREDLAGIMFNFRTFAPPLEPLCGTRHPVCLNFRIQCATICQLCNVEADCICKMVTHFFSHQHLDAILRAVLFKRFYLQETPIRR